MRTEGLRCPHGRPVEVVCRTGLFIYRHIDNDSPCELLNSFTLSPEDILTAIATSILDNREYEGFLTTEQTLDGIRKNLCNVSDRNRRFTEFFIIFKRSRTVRDIVYRKIAELSKSPGKNTDGAKLLFSLVIVMLTSSRIKEDDRQYQRVLSDFYCAFGHGYFAARDKLAVFSGDERDSQLALSDFDKAMEFHKKYVYPIRGEDDYRLTL